MKQQSILPLLLLALPATTVAQQAGSITTDDFAMRAGEVKVITLNLTTKAADLQALQCDVCLPEGLRVTEYIPGKRGVNAEATEYHTVGVQNDVTVEGQPLKSQVVGTALNETTFTPGDGPAGLLRLQATGDLADGTYQGWLKNVKLFNTSSTPTTLDDQPFTITIKSGNPQVLLDGTYYYLDDEDTEGEPYVPQTYNCADVYLQRTFKTGRWNTLCVPFAMTRSQVVALFGAGTEVAAFEGEASIEGEPCLRFRKVTTGVQANVPCLLWPGTEVQPDTLTCVAVTPAATLTVEGDGYNMVGTYDYVESLQGLYYINDNSFYKGTKNYGECYPFRAYFEPTTEEAANHLGLTFDDDDTTGLNRRTVITDDRGDMYGLDGKKIQSPRRGIYIQNGKKQVNK